MNSPFNLSKTPTLQAVASADEQVLIQDLQKRLEDALRSAHETPDVAEAAESHRTADSEHANLQTATRTLNDQAKQLRADLALATKHAVESLIVSAASGGKIDFGGTAKVAALELSDRLITHALQMLVEHKTPISLFRKLRAEAHALATRARSIEATAHQRAERVLGQMRDAVTDEVVLPVDMSKGVSGALLSQAVELKRVAVEVSTEADRLENAYVDRNKKS